MTTPANTPMEMMKLVTKANLRSKIGKYPFPSNPRAIDAGGGKRVVLRHERRKGNSDR